MSDQRLLQSPETVSLNLNNLIEKGMNEKKNSESEAG